MLMSTLEDYFDKLPVVEGEPNHLRLDGELSGGFFCQICGGPLLDGQDGTHSVAICPDNQELVGELTRRNMVDSP
jgi:hypothetical protein